LSAQQISAETRADTLSDGASDVLSESSDGGHDDVDNESYNIFEP
jgi:hypothetical protein